MTLTEEDIAELKHERYMEYQRDYEENQFYAALSDWISDNKNELMSEFIEDEGLSERFKDYCKIAFKECPSYDEIHPPRPR